MCFLAAEKQRWPFRGIDLIRSARELRCRSIERDPSISSIAARFAFFGRANYSKRLWGGFGDQEREHCARLPAGIAFGLSTITVYAQTTAPTVSNAPIAATAATGDSLVEVVVTGQRRNENAQTVPITISVISGANLRREQHRDAAGSGART